MTFNFLLVTSDVATRVQELLKSGLESDFVGLGLGIQAKRLGLGITGLGLDSDFKL
jgi:hypothetical protein